MRSTSIPVKLAKNKQWGGGYEFILFNSIKKVGA